MISKRQMLSAIVVIVIIVVASLSIGLINSRPKPSESSAMIITASDAQASLGGDWHGFVQDIEPGLNDNETSIARSELDNGTIDVSFTWVNVFENESACHAVVLSWIESYSFNASESRIGNESYTDWNGISDHVYLIFREGRVAVWILVGMPHPTGWLYDTALSLAQLQLEKIDHYLAG